MSPSGHATSDYTIRKVSVKDIVDDNFIKSGSSDKISVTTRILDEIDILHDFDNFTSVDDQNTLSNYQKLLNEAGRHYGKTPGNVRNIYGLIADDRSIFLYRSDIDYTISYSLDGRPERPLWKNGNPFSIRTENLPFKFDGPDVITLASGGVLRISPDKPLKDETAGQSRAILINGDDPSRYYGYWTAEGVRPKNVSPKLAALIDQAWTRHRDSHVTGLAVHNATGGMVFSYGPFRTEDGIAVFRHEVHRDGQTRTIECGGEPVAQHELRRAGDLFVDRYSRPGNTRTVLFLDGGPGGHRNLDRSFPGDMDRMLDQGLNIDVIHYGGSGYTFGLFNRLFQRGPASIRRDAKTIERYVAETYSPHADVSLYAFSFGAVFYRHFDQAFLDRLDHVVLHAPSGSVSDHDEGIDALAALASQQPPGAETIDIEGLRALSRSVNRQFWGAKTIDEQNAYYRNLKTCPLKRRTTVIAGKTDTTVHPLDDYRLCVGGPMLDLVEHNYNHDGYDRTSGEFRGREVVGMAIAKLLEPPVQPSSSPPRN
jgi:hypothetical protein